MKNYICLLALGFLLFSCQDKPGDDAFEDCKYGKPEAIFSAELEEVKKHRFRMKKKEGIETISFHDGMELVIYQSGCDHIQQQYQFELPPAGDTIDTQQAEYWIAQTITAFQSLGDLGPEFFSYSSWAQAIAEKAAEFKLAEFLEVQPGFFVKIDRIESSDKATLIVTLSEAPES